MRSQEQLPVKESLKASFSTSLGFRAMYKSSHGTVTMFVAQLGLLIFGLLPSMRQLRRLVKT